MYLVYLYYSLDNFIWYLSSHILTEGSLSTYSLISTNDIIPFPGYKQNPIQYSLTPSPVELITNYEPLWYYNSNVPSALLQLTFSLEIRYATTKYQVSMGLSIIMVSCPCLNQYLDTTLDWVKR